jgi:hypothetical protein
MPYKKVEDMIVSLHRSEYTWTPFLMDSPKIITIAIITTSCLEATDDPKWGRRYQRGWQECGKSVKVRGYPVLATSLFVNESKQLVSKSSEGFPAENGTHAGCVRKQDSHWEIMASLRF